MGGLMLLVVLLMMFKEQTWMIMQAAVTAGIMYIIYNYLRKDIKKQVTPTSMQNYKFYVSLCSLR